MTSLSPNQALVLGKNDERSSIKPILLHYVLGLRFGNLKRSNKREKPQPARVLSQCIVHYGKKFSCFSRVG